MVHLYFMALNISICIGAVAMIDQLLVKGWRFAGVVGCWLLGFFLLCALCVCFLLASTGFTFPYLTKSTLSFLLMGKSGNLSHTNVSCGDAIALDTQRYLAWTQNSASCIQCIVSINYQTNYLSNVK
jgi:hypothetical protein